MAIKTNQQTNPQVAYGTQHYKLINLGSYKNDLNLIRKHKGKIHEAIMVTWDDFSISDRSHQTRASDTDIGHVAALAADIENNGLEVLPTVEWNNRTNKFVPLGGHHRIFAMLRIGWAEFPVLVASFRAEMQRLHYLMADNNHRPSKRHSKDDAIKSLKRVDATGQWKGLTDEKRREKVYEYMKEFFPFIVTSAKKTVYEQVFKPRSYLKKYTAEEVAIFMRGRYTPKYKKSGHRSGDVVYVGSVWDAGQKAIEMAQLDRAEEKLRGTTTSNLAAKLVTHFPEKVKDLDAERKSALHRYTAKNIHAAGCCIVDEIVFLPQKLGTCREHNPMTYQWDRARQAFV